MRTPLGALAQIWGQTCGTRQTRRRGSNLARTASAHQIPTSPRPRPPAPRAPPPGRPRPPPAPPAPRPAPHPRRPPEMRTYVRPCTPSSTATPPSRSSTGPRCPMSWCRPPWSSGTAQSRSPTTTRCRARWSSPSPRGRSACARSMAPSSISMMGATSPCWSPMRRGGPISAGCSPTRMRIRVTGARGLRPAPPSSPCRRCSSMLAVWSA